MVVKTCVFFCKCQHTLMSLLLYLCVYQWCCPSNPFIFWFLQIFSLCWRKSVKRFTGIYKGKFLFWDYYSLPTDRWDKDVLFFQTFSVLLYCHFFCFTLSLFISLWQSSRSEVGWGTISPSSSLTAREKFRLQRLGHAAPAEYYRSCKSSVFQLVTSNLGSRCWKWCSGV